MIDASGGYAVDEPRHGRFYRLMKRFKDKTGCSVIVNTSFNMEARRNAMAPEREADRLRHYAEKAMHRAAGLDWHVFVTTAACSLRCS